MSGGTRSYEFSRRLVQRGHRVNLIAGAPPGRADHEWRTTIEGGVTVHWCPTEYSQRMNFKARVKSFASYAVRAARYADVLPKDVLFASSTPLTVALPGAYASRRAGVPMVFEVRDVWPEVPIAMGLLDNPLLRFSARRLEAWAYGQSSSVITLSPDMERSIRSRFPGTSVITIPNSSDVDLFPAPDPGDVAAVRRERPWLGEGPVVVYTGTFGAVNNVGWIVDVAAELLVDAPDVRFLLVGEGGDKPGVEVRARDAGVLGRNLFVEPPVPKRQVPALVAAADLCTSFVADIPALWANSANKVFDAFAAARPVAVNTGGWIANLLEETGAGLALPPQDPVAAAKMLASRLHDQDWLERARSASAELARTKFNRDAQFDEFEGVLNAAVERAASTTQ